jgi:hypothetical protein
MLCHTLSRQTGGKNLLPVHFLLETELSVLASENTTHTIK